MLFCEGYSAVCNEKQNADSKFFSVTFLHLPKSGILLILLFDKSSSSIVGRPFNACKHHKQILIICYNLIYHYQELTLEYHSGNVCKGFIDIFSESYRTTDFHQIPHTFFLLKSSYCNAVSLFQS